MHWLSATESAICFQFGNTVSSELFILVHSGVLESLVKMLLWLVGFTASSDV